MDFGCAKSSSSARPASVRERHGLDHYARARNRRHGLRRRPARSCTWPPWSTRARSPAGAGRDVDVAYYLIHSMGRGANGDFLERERAAARAFARMARAEGVSRMVTSAGLATARPPARRSGRLRAGRRSPTSEPGRSSARKRVLPHAIDDVLTYLALGPEVVAAEAREVQTGGSRHPHIRRDARRDGGRARHAPASAAPRTPAHPVAVVALDRARDPRGRRGRPAADREPPVTDIRDRSVGRRPLPGGPTALRRGPSTGTRRGAQRG